MMARPHQHGRMAVETDQAYRTIIIGRGTPVRALLRRGCAGRERATAQSLSRIKVHGGRGLPEPFCCRAGACRVIPHAGQANSCPAACRVQQEMLSATASHLDFKHRGERLSGALAEAVAVLLARLRLALPASASRQAASTRSRRTWSSARSSSVTTPSAIMRSTVSAISVQGQSVISPASSSHLDK